MAHAQTERVGEFSGANELANAGSKLLEDPLLDMVVIRNFIDPSLPIFKRISSMPHYPSVEDIGIDTNALDNVVKTWLSTKIPEVEVVQNLRVAEIKEKSTQYHFDPLFLSYGPLSLSVRTDTANVERMFYATRPNLCSIFNGGPYTANTQKMQDTADKLNKQQKETKSRVQQYPGDAVLFTNHPYPTIHRAKTPDHETVAALLTYKITF